MITNQMETRHSRQEDAAPMPLTDNSILAAFPNIGTPKDVADALNLPTSHVRQMCREGRLRAFKVGSLWRVPKAWLQDFITGGESRD